MIKYTIRSRDLIGIYNELKTKRLIPDAYFQRNLVWRDIHKQDFIKTILLGYPFPQIFISKGKVDVEAMQTTSCVVDGQQRCNAIVEYLEDRFEVEGRRYSELEPSEKADFLKYEIAVIELDIENTDPRIRDIFQRVNRTANSLTAIEKMASEFAPSEFMFFCRVLSADIDIDQHDEDFKLDPNIPSYLLDWAKKKNFRPFQKIILDNRTFSEREVIRKVQLQYVLNIVATIQSDYFNRNEGTWEMLENFTEEFPDKDVMFTLLTEVSKDYGKLKFPIRSMWRSKSNFFTLIVELARAKKAGEEYDIDVLFGQLSDFEENAPEEYRFAAKEAVNNRQQRIFRAGYVREMIEAALIR